MNTQVQAVSFSILDNAVRIIDGLYSLNDLHKASGNENKHRPSLFMANAQTKDLINELNSEAGITASLNKRSVKTIKGGDTNLQGTYVCRELVYSYAMWISAKFHLMVIRAFDAMYAPSVEHAELPVPPKNLHLALTKAIKTIGKGNRQNYSALYTRVYEKFQVNSYNAKPLLSLLKVWKVNLLAVIKLPHLSQV